MASSTDTKGMGEPVVKAPVATGVDSALFDMRPESIDLGAHDSMRRHVLTWVLEGRYDKAIEELKSSIEGESKFPGFAEKVSRYVNHSVDLIYAIKAKRGFSGINSLTRSKQQELREKFIEHFKELQHVLKTIEKIEYDLRLTDIRSTVYVVRAVWLAGLALAILAFWMEIMNGLARTSLTVFDDGLVKFADWVAGLIGF